MNRLELLTATVPLLYTTKTRQKVSSYYAKEGAENLLGIYICDDEYRRAMLSAGFLLADRENVEYQRVHRLFVANERFPMEWLGRSPETRPKGVKQTVWNDFLHAKATAKTLIESILERDPDHPLDSTNVRITRVVGHHV